MKKIIPIAFLPFFLFASFLTKAQQKKGTAKKQAVVKQVKDKIVPKDKPADKQTDKGNNSVSQPEQKSMLGSGAELLEETGLTSATSDNMANAIREMLVLASNRTIQKLGAVDGFLLDSAIKIELPSDASKVTGTLKKLGMGKLVDDAILSVNRAAESAVASSKEELTAAIKNLTITDVVEIINSKDTGATRYMRNQCTVSLKARMRPIVDVSLKKSNATKYWSDVFSNYNKISKTKINPDLTDYVNEHVLSAMFNRIGMEEMSIRNNPGDGAGKILKDILGKP